jgi:Flp pilus assembly protein CpaB
MYKYAIKVDGVKAVSGWVQPGDHVDVQLTETLPNGKVKSGFILRDVLVLAVDTRPFRDPNGQAVTQVNAVSVAVSSKESLYLSAAERRGEVKLVLRDISNKDKKDVDPTQTIPGFDKRDNTEPATVAAAKITTVVKAKVDVPANTFINKDNFETYFTTKEVPEDSLEEKAVRDISSLYDKFVTRALEADQTVFKSWLSDEKASGDKPPVVMAEQGDPAEVLPQPRERPHVKPLYPRKFEQIINSHRVWFIETAPGEFRRADAPTAPPELKDLPDTDGRPEKKPEEPKGERPV